MPTDSLAKPCDERYGIFAREYSIHLNATKAAISAGYSPKSAGVTGCKLLKHPKVKEILGNVLTKRVEKLELNGDSVLGKLSEIAFLSKRPSFYRSADQIKSLELLGKHLRLFHDETNNNQTNFTVIFTDAERAKAIDIASRLMED